MDTYQQPNQQMLPEASAELEQYDQIWRKVLPELNTFPESRNEEGNLPGTPLPDDDITMLPGAQQNPCCLGTAAQQSIGVIIGFTEGEIASCRFFKAFIQCAPTMEARQVMQQIIANEIDNVRRLRAIYYLITGQCFYATRQIEMPKITNYCTTLREAYHEETCASFNYFRAAVGAPDPCLRALFERLGNVKKRHAEAIVNLLGAVIC